MQRPIIVQLDHEYFNKDDSLVIQQPIAEALKKSQRPYVEGTLVADENNTYFVPFRSNLNPKLTSEFPELVLKLPTDDKPQAGLDLTKLVVVSNELNFKVNRGYIGRDQYNDLSYRQDELQTKIENYIKGYKQEILQGKPLSPQYRFSTLKSFHKELVLPEAKTHLIEDRRLEQAAQIIKTAYAYDKDSDIVLNFLKNHELPLAKRLTMANKIIYRQQAHVNQLTRSPKRQAR